MASAGTITPSDLLPATSATVDALLALPKKRAIIALRWPLVIICSYLLAYSGDARVVPGLVHGFLLLYIATNGVLYFVDERLFESPYFYVPLVIFDTFSIAVSLSLTPQVGADFYLACFFTIFLCCICHDFRGLIGIAVLAPLLYGYAVFQATEVYDPSIFLRIPFPFVIALFYGYFIQVERLQKTLDERRDQLLRQEQAQERLQRHLPQVAILHEIDLAINSTLDLRTLLNLLLEKIEIYPPYPSASAVRLLVRETGVMEPVVCRNLDEEKWKSRSKAEEKLAHMVAQKKEPCSVRDIRSDKEIQDSELAVSQGLVSFLGIPLIAKGEIVGVLSIYTEEEREFSQEEIRFLDAIGADAAIAIHNAELYETMRRQAIELEKAGKVRDRFLGVMSHELRTPLAAMVGYTGLVRDKLLGEINQKQEEALEKVLARGKDLLEMITSILYATTIGAGTIKVEKAEINLKDFLEEIKSVYAVRLGKDIRLNWEYASVLPLIQSDRLKLKHILQNLINNAIRFTEEGSVTVSAGYVPERRIVQFKVSDTGIGIPKNALPIIFEIFRQVDSSETRPHVGVGLGLYIVKTFTQLLGGGIEVESEPGKGSTFIVTLPLDVAPRVEGRAKKRILVVEDRPDLSDLLRQALEILGYEVMLATDCEEAVRMAAASLPDLIVMDIVLPRLDGLEATSRIRKNPVTRSIPILAVTALAMPGDKEKCLASGCDDYIAKPFTINELNAAITRLSNKEFGGTKPNVSSHVSH
ncbi:MAG: response regulator [Deltaproteobacteria bacterium]|nr:response regulator [Deltaproteobacteria bacterium]